jgi:hypothetical protein
MALEPHPVDGGRYRLAMATDWGGLPRAVSLVESRRAEFADELYAPHEHRYR